MPTLHRLTSLTLHTQPLAAPAADQWYPPVRGTLLLLSKLYRCVDTRIFAGLAQEAVAACTVTVQVCVYGVGVWCRCACVLAAVASTPPHAHTRPIHHLF
jgi:hypothetical protein